MAIRPLRRTASVADVAAVARSGRLSTAAAALAVSTLGLALAGSLTLPAGAEPLRPPPVAGAQPTAGRPASPSPSLDPSLTEAFTFGGDGGEPLRKAIVAERAAQRAEELAKNAEAVSRAAAQASTKLRQGKLTADEKATQAKGAELARQALERAAAARAAAVTARAEAEAAARGEAEAAARGEAEAAAQGTGSTATTAPAAPGPPPPLTSGPGGVSPVPGAVVGASFGQYGLWSRYHTGVDFRAGYGVAIKSVKSGVVLFSGNSGNWAGNYVAVKHVDGMTTMSSHMSSMTVSAGQSVQAGQVIGYVGQTGRAFGAHLHFELYPAGATYGDVYRAIDPVPWLRNAGVQTR